MTTQELESYHAGECEVKRLRAENTRLREALESAIESLHRNGAHESADHARKQYAAALKGTS